MLAKQALITEDILPHEWSSESMDFINSLLQRKESKRLGYNGGARGSEELMKHLWLRYYPWHDLKNKTLLAPFIPDPKDNFDKLYCESIDKISEETQLNEIRRIFQIISNTSFNIFSTESISNFSIF